ncbi:MAG: peptide ABC transporter substrate-binding protein [Prochloraceae cyanobacterium]
MLRKIIARPLFISIASLSIASSLLLSACNNQPANNNKILDRKEFLKLLYWQAPTILNPHLSAGSKDLEASRITIEPLASFNNSSELVPFLAAEIPSQENGGIAEDGRSVTWKLKPDLKWSDGQPFTAEDVVFTYEFVSDPEVGAFSSGIYDIIETVEAIDDNTVKINFKNVTPAWYTVFVGQYGGILPKHIYENYQGPNAREAPANLKPIGTGPYRAIEFKPGDVVVYEANPYFREPDRLSFEKIELKGGGDVVSTARSVLQTGDADYAYNLQIEPAILARLEAGGRGKVVSNLGAYTERIVINHSDPNTATPDGERSNKDIPHPFFSDRRVRQALALAVDRDTIAKRLYGVTGKPTANILVIPEQYNSTNTSYEYNLQKAARLLDEAGWRDTNGDGVRDKNGVEMQILFQTSVNSVREKTQEIIKQALQEIGVVVELKTIDPAVFFSSDPANQDTVERFYADWEMFSRQTDSPDPSIYMKVYTCDEIPQKANNWIGDNASRYCNREYDELWRRSLTELDPEKRRQMFIEMNDLIVENTVVIPLVHRANVIAVSNELKGIEMTPWDARTWNIMEWRKE